MSTFCRFGYYRYQLVSYFACEEGTTAQLLSDNSLPISSEGPVVDLEGRVLLQCVPEPDEAEADPASPTEESESCLIRHAKNGTLVLPSHYLQLDCLVLAIQFAYHQHCSSVYYGL